MSFPVIRVTFGLIKALPFTVYPNFRPCIFTTELCEWKSPFLNFLTCSGYPRQWERLDWAIESSSGCLECSAFRIFRAKSEPLERISVKAVTQYHRASNNEQHCIQELHSGRRAGNTGTRRVCVNLHQKTLPYTNTHLQIHDSALISLTHNQKNTSTQTSFNHPNQPGTQRNSNHCFSLNFSNGT